MKRLETDELWTAVDFYIADHLVGDDAALTAALEASEAAGLPPINVAPNQGKLLMLLAQMIGARRMLEIGTLAGYSTIWLARGLTPGGRLITLELDPRCAEVARTNLARAGLGGSGCVIDRRQFYARRVYSTTRTTNAASLVRA